MSFCLPCTAGRRASGIIRLACVPPPQKKPGLFSSHCIQLNCVLFATKVTRLRAATALADSDSPLFITWSRLRPLGAGGGMLHNVSLAISQRCTDLVALSTPQRSRRRRTWCQSRLKTIAYRGVSSRNSTQSDDPFPVAACAPEIRAPGGYWDNARSNGAFCDHVIGVHARCRCPQECLVLKL